MPNSQKATNMQENSPLKRESITTQSGRKAPGTRLGTMLNWRGGSNGSGKISGRHGHTIRDGR